MEHSLKTRMCLKSLLSGTICLPSRQKILITFQNEIRVGNYLRFALQKLQPKTIALEQAIRHAFRILIEFALKLCNEGQSNNNYYFDYPNLWRTIVLIIRKQIKLI